MAIRTYGLSGSGIDVDQMVKDLMKAQRTKYDSMVQKKTQLEWKKADFNTMYTTVSDFRNTVFNYKLSNTLSPKQVESTNETVVTATANSDAANVSHTITVANLAAGVTLTSSAAVTSGSSKDTLVNQVYGGTAPTPATFNLKISDGTTEKEITIDTGESINDFVSSINNAGLNIKANYDTTLDRFFLYTTKTGANTKIDFSSNDPVGDGMKFLQDKLHLATATQTGTDAEFTLDGVANLTQASNNFTISGVTYSLKTAGTSSVTVAGDTDKAIASVVSFIEAYNSTLSKINSELDEARYKDFSPLTTDQRAAMSETEAKTWEDKAKSGMLRREPILRDLVNKMRNDIANPISGVSGNYNSLASIGIVTGNYSEGGKLYLDETKLKAAIEADPDIINKLFGASGDSSSKQGIATRLYDTLKGGMDKIANEAGYSASTTGDTKSALAQSILDYDKRMTDLDARLSDMEDRYYKQFDAMETALNKLNQQSSWLSQQLGSK